MPAPRSNGPNRCPLGETGVDEDYGGTFWICAESALRRAIFECGIDASDWVTGMYPPDLRSILAYEV